MKFEEIKIDNNNSFFKTNITEIDTIKLIKDLKLNIELNKNTTYSTKNRPGIQSTIIIKTETLKELHDKIIDKICYQFNYGNKTKIPYYTMEWAYISNKENKYSEYHIHANNDMINEIVEWTFVYYVQMPTNLKEKDGRLFFKLDNGYEMDILPETGDLLLFSSKLKHRPETNENSDIERIVYAGNFIYLDYNKHYIKNTKTII